MADSVVATAQESKDNLTVTTNNLRRSKRIPQIHTAQNVASNHVYQTKPRVTRAIDPVRRRKKG
jgi:hypothetical protein